MSSSATASQSTRRASLTRGGHVLVCWWGTICGQNVHFCIIAPRQTIRLINVFQFLSNKKAALKLPFLFLFFYQGKTIVQCANAWGQNETCSAQSIQEIYPTTGLPMLTVYSILLGFPTLCVGRHLKWETQTLGLCETAALMSWLHYYFIQLPSAIRAISYSNDFCE